MTDTDVVVVGGGSTGTGIARDLALRGVDVTLFERGQLTDGTTGRMHGLLHSGARYAVSDEASARDCIEENRILRQIAQHCIEETGGLFLKLPTDSSEYFDRKLAGCRACGIPTEVLEAEAVREREPYVTDDIDRAIQVPDAAIDPFRLVVANAMDAQAHGARIETHATVTDLLIEEDRVRGVRVRHGDGPERDDPRAGRVERIEAEHVVNATGVWAGELASQAGIEIGLRPSKGAMVVTNCRQIDTVLNRCRPKGDADIIVPHETTAILGTTDVEIEDPSSFEENDAEVDLLIETLSAMVPMLQEARTLRSYWGVRPLYEPPGVESDSSSEVTRSFFILDHGDRDDRPGLTSVVGGKFATYRKMAEATSDQVCDHLGISQPCRTDERPLPGSEDPERLQAGMDRFGLRSPVARRSQQRLGSRAAEVLDVAQNPVVCACEAVTQAEVADAIGQVGADLNAVRIRTRASMGTCQGGFCAHRLAAQLHPEWGQARVFAALEGLVEERWKGQRHALWGEQLSQAMLNYALQATTMNLAHDPAAQPERIAFEAFDSGREEGP